MAILFVVRLNVESNALAYKHFIEGMRYRLQSTYLHDRPVLPSPENPPTEWFDIVLFTNSGHEIVLRIRSDNLYLDGYQMGSSGQWLEFGRDNSDPPSPHLISGSSFLFFDGGYPSLEHVAGLRQYIPLGGQPLLNAVNKLYDSTNQTDRACSLIVVIQMICESIRFDRISSHLANTFNGNLDGSGERVYSSPPEWMLLLENGWQDMSDAVQHADADVEFEFPRWEADDMVISTAREALDALGLLLYHRYPGCALRSVRGTTIQDEKCSELQRPLVEVFSVRIDNVDGEDPGQLYGTITVNDGLGSQCVYHREKGDYETIPPGEDALLTGPCRSISALGSFTINMDLKDYDFFFFENESNKGQISWNVFNTTNEYDKVLSKTGHGYHGKREKDRVTVNYAVLSDAVKATVEVMLIKGQEDTVEIYGKITACSCNFFANKSVLFLKTSNEYLSVKTGDPIPLSRSVVAVPMNSSLAVHAKLYDYNTVSHDDVISNDFALFNALSSGTFEENISCEYGEIKVKVTWG